MLPLHVQQALNGSISLLNSTIAEQPKHTPTQARYHALQSKHAPSVILSNDSISAIDDKDYSFDYHEALPNEFISNELEA